MGGKFHPKLNTCGRPIANKYREGKMKRTLKRESKVLEIAEIEGMASSIGAGISPGRTRARSLRNWLWPLRCGWRPRRQPVLSSGLGQDGFAVVENRRREGGRPLGGGPYRPGRMDCRGSRRENPHRLRAVGSSVQWLAGAGGMQCLASAAGRQLRDRLTCGGLGS